MRSTGFTIKASGLAACAFVAFAVPAAIEMKPALANPANAPEKAEAIKPPAPVPAKPAPPKTVAKNPSAPVATTPPTAAKDATAKAADPKPAIAAKIPPPPASKAPAPKDAKAKAAEPKPVIAAKTLFGAAKTAAPLVARAIGGYAKGCLAGGKALAVNGAAWQAMRLSRNRNWGHPKLVALVQRLALDAKKNGEWNGLLVGDLAQPRGGPMLTGHASHQIGLDADIWLTPMPDRTLTRKEREEISATPMVAEKGSAVDPAIWSERHLKIIKRAASYPQVDRIFVHPAIKKALCEGAGADRGWLRKVRPMWGHNYHFHIRIGCPAGSSGCSGQKPPPDGDGCGKEVTDWIARVTRPPPPPPKTPVKPAKPKPPITLEQLPSGCRTVLAAPAPRIKEPTSGVATAKAD